MFRASDIQRIATMLRAARFNPDHPTYAPCTEDTRQQREIGAEIVARQVASALTEDLKRADISERGFLAACGLSEP